MKPGRILVFVGVAMLAMTACSRHTDAPFGVVRFENDSDHVIVVARGLDLEHALHPTQGSSSHPFGREGFFRSQLYIKQDDGSWCNPADLDLWILGSKENPTDSDDFPLPDDPTVPLDPDDLVILEHIEGPYCFEDGETYTFTG